MPSNTEITPKQLARLIGTPYAPILVDICIDEDFAEDPRLVPGAFRWPFREIEALIPRLTGRQVVITFDRPILDDAHNLFVQLAVLVMFGYRVSRISHNKQLVHNQIQ